MCLITFLFYFFKNLETKDLSKGKLTVNQLISGAWLTDTEINLFLELLRKQFKHVNGLEDPLMITHENYMKKYFKSIKKADDFIRVMISNDNHWVCVAGGLYVEDEDVCLYDSSPRNGIDNVLGKNLANVVSDRVKSRGVIRVRLQNTQKQQASFCGYFALANATAVCYGIDPERILFDENQIRQHFIDCVYNGKKLSMFPFRENYQQTFEHKYFSYRL